MSRLLLASIAALLMVLLVGDQDGRANFLKGPPPINGGLTGDGVPLTGDGLILVGR